jgi:serine/threonine-protein kinase HipA
VLKKSGVDPQGLSPVQWLSIVGSSGMGALCYVPETKLLQEDCQLSLDEMQQMALDVLSEKTDENADFLYFKSGNSGGVRPKAILHDADGHWLVKFRHTYDPKDIGQQEYHYNEVARRCGINVPDFKLMNGRYFASRRFDLDANGQRIHTATAGGLLCLSLANPVLDYSNLLALTGYLTQSAKEVEEMFRRMVFNYLTENKDDHCKNFSFFVKQEPTGRYVWHLAPAYDLTLCTEGYNGEHATSVNGTGNPTLADMIAVGTKIKMREERCREIFEEVASSCGDLLLHRIK